MSFVQEVKPKGQHIAIQFEFVNFKRTLKMNVNPRVSIKSLRPLFANKFNSDFAHMNIKVATKGQRKELIDTDTPFYQIGYFSLLNQPQYTLEVEIEYEGG